MIGRYIPYGLLLAGWAFAAEAGEGQPLDMTGAINFALTQNRDLVRLALRLDSALLSEEGAKNIFKPDVKPLGSVGRSDDATSFGYGLAALQKFGWGGNVELSAQASDAGLADSEYSARSAVRVEAGQPLLRHAGPLVTLEPLRKARSGVAAARRTLEMRRTDLIVETVAVYENILRLQRQLESDTMAVARLERLFRLSRAKERQGRGTRVDSLRVELQVGQAEARLENTREQLLSLRQDFADLLGFSPETMFDLASPSALDVEVPESDDAAIAIALANRLDYAQALQDYRDAARGVRIAARDLLPDVRLVGRYERFGDGQNTSESWDLDQDEWFVGLVADTDILKRDERIARQQAVISKETARENIDSARSTIARQVAQQKLAYARAQSEVVIAGRNLELAAGRLKLARRLYELGRGDNFAVSDAEDEMLKAEQEQLRTRAEVSIAGYRLLRALGTLVDYPEDLRPVELEE